MSAMSSPSDDVAARERRRAAEMTIGEVSTHVRRGSWPERAPDADVGPLEAWREATPIHYPKARRGAVARFHEPTELILLARQGGLVTCYPLSNRPRDTRRYIRNQVTEQ